MASVFLLLNPTLEKKTDISGDFHSSASPLASPEPANLCFQGVEIGSCKVMLPALFCLKCSHVDRSRPCKRLRSMCSTSSWVSGFTHRNVQPLASTGLLLPSSHLPFRVRS